MSLTSDYQDGVQDEGSSEETDAGESGERSFICLVCQRPVTEVESRRWRGEPVHGECGAELRCGVSVGRSYDDD